MSTPVETEELVQELKPDTGAPSNAVIAYQILDTLKDNDDDVAYRVWLKLSNKFGAGQRI